LSYAGAEPLFAQRGPYWYWPIDIKYNVEFIDHSLG
jgi:hypothetical protein